MALKGLHDLAPPLLTLSQPHWCPCYFSSRSGILLAAFRLLYGIFSGRLFLQKTTHLPSLPPSNLYINFIYSVKPTLNNLFKLLFALFLELLIPLTKLYVFHYMYCLLAYILIDLLIPFIVFICLHTLECKIYKTETFFLFCSLMYVSSWNSDWHIQDTHLIFVE